MSKKTIEFKVTVNYSSENDALISPDVMRYFLAEALEVERQEGGLTLTLDLSANWVIVVLNEG